MAYLFLRFRGTGNWGIMKITKAILFIFLAIGLITSCIERYIPDSELDFVPNLIIDATIVPDEGEQEIVISESSSPESPEFIPVSGCKVTVEDDKGHRFNFSESDQAGRYRGVIDGQFVIIGSKYRLSVVTPQGKSYISSFEELMPCPPVDSVFYEIESRPTTDPEKNEDGLQFLINFKGSQTDGHFYRWQVEETYEYHSSFPLDRWRDEDLHIHDLTTPDYSNFICYKTANLGDIFVLSTEGFASNSYKKFKLQFVNNLTQRLQHQYSILVRQYSISKGAYQYWESLKKNNQESVDLFGRQPANVKGNISNTNDSTEQTLGYFGVSSVNSKRIMIYSVPGMKFDQVFYCKAIPIDAPLPPDGAIYFAWAEKNGEKVLGTTNEECIFCPILGGTTEKPSYWDK